MDVKAEQTVEESPSTAFRSTALLLFVIVFGFRARLPFDIAQGGELVEPRTWATTASYDNRAPCIWADGFNTAPIMDYLDYLMAYSQFHC